MGEVEGGGVGGWGEGREGRFQHTFTRGLDVLIGFAPYFYLLYKQINNKIAMSAISLSVISLPTCHYSLTTATQHLCCGV